MREESETIRVFEAGLAAEVSAASVASYLVDLYYALLVLRPGDDWTWLRRRNHELRTRVVPKRQRKKRPGARRARLCVPFEDWPPEARRRWQAALAGGDRLASLKRRIASSTRRRHSQGETAPMLGPHREQLTEGEAGPKRRGVGRKPPGSWSEAYKNRIQRGFGMWLGWRKAQGFADAQPEATQPELWIHGHTHDSCDYRIGRTRVICNPRGYLPDEPNQEFMPDLVLEL